MDVLPDALEQLAARLETLERRVEVLEHPTEHSAAPEAATAPAPAPPPTAEAGEGLSFAQAGGVLSVLAYALLGIAGAYALRYIAESSSLPKLAIAAVAIVYALLWLVGAARVPSGARFASVVYAGTSALILAPMLWELTLSFKVLPSPATAGILGAFVIASGALGWKQDRMLVLWVANGTAAATALALSVATHQLEPFIATLLLMALVGECAPGQRSVRPLAAAAADAAIWALLFIYSSPQSTRMEYPAIGAAGLLAPACLLFLIYGASVTLRTTLLRRKMTVFEAGQAMAAFLLAASSVLAFAPRNRAMVLGAVCLLFSAGCYVAAFVLFGNAGESRNRRVFGAWAAGLLLAGCLLSLPPFWLAAGLGLAAMAATALGVRLDAIAPTRASARLTLLYHGLVFLLAAAIASGLLEYAFEALAGAVHARLAGSAMAVTACAIVCYAAGKRDPQESWQLQVLHLITAALAAFALAAFLVEGLVALAALRTPPEAHHVAFLRTLILCAMALALAFAGSRWRRIELTRLAYASLALVAAKLLFEDMRLGHLEFIAASIFLFAIALIAVPRLARMSQKA
ncbi:MAG: hypothetical protein ABSD44_05815 [Terracidiphilus sp.]